MGFGRLRRSSLGLCLRWRWFDRGLGQLYHVLRSASKFPMLCKNGRLEVGYCCGSLTVHIAEALREGRSAVHVP